MQTPHTRSAVRCRKPKSIGKAKGLRAREGALEMRTFLRKLLNRPNDSLEELAREAVTAVRNRYLQR